MDIRPITHRPPVLPRTALVAVPGDARPSEDRVSLGVDRGGEVAAAPPQTRVSVRERIREIVDARLMLMPGPVAAAIALCAAASPEIARKEDGAAVTAAKESLAQLGRAVTDEVLARVSLDDEVQDSRQFARGFMRAFEPAPVETARVQAVIGRVEAATPTPLTCQAKVLGGAGWMAFGRGGENIYLSSDFLGLPEDELAAMLAHERAHLLERHLTRSAVVSSVGSVLAERAGEAETPTVERVAKLAEAELQRAHELEADARGAEMLDAAGYGRAALPRMLTRLVPQDRPQSPLDDHPPVAVRIAALQG